MPNLLSTMSFNQKWRYFHIVAMAIGITVSAGAGHSAWAKGKIDVCEKSLPKDLKASIQRTYPDYQLVRLSMLTDVGQEIYSRDSKGGCPGAAKVRFFDENKIDYALVILTSADHARPYNSTYDLVVARKGDDGSWNLTILEKDVQAAPPAVLTLPPGKYTGETEQQPRTLVSQTEVLFVVKYEAWSVVYAVTENGIEKVWLSD